jgi:hypothetical protein
MPDKREKTPRDCAVLPAINPSDGSQWDLLLRHAKMDSMAKRGPGAARELAFTVLWALLHPTAIFRGVREEGEHNWLCYVSVPSMAYDHKTGNQRAGWPGEVFLVFVNEDRIIYNWRWEKADVTDIRLPENHQSRFDEQVL